MGAGASQPWRLDGTSLLLHVRLTPRGGRDALEGLVAGADGRVMLRAKVAAAPTDGAANDALLRLLARTLRTPMRDLALVAGGAARVKIVRAPLAAKESLEFLLRDIAPPRA